MQIMDFFSQLYKTIKRCIMEAFLGVVAYINYYSTAHICKNNLQG